jgi:hypothetical protein
VLPKYLLVYIWWHRRLGILLPRKRPIKMCSLQCRPLSQRRKVLLVSAWQIPVEFHNKQLVYSVQQGPV